MPSDQESGDVELNNIPSTALLNLGDVELKEAVEPLYKLLTATMNQLRQTNSVAKKVALPRLAHDCIGEGFKLRNQAM